MISIKQVVKALANPKIIHNPDIGIQHLLQLGNVHEIT